MNHCEVPQLAHSFLRLVPFLVTQEAVFPISLLYQEHPILILRLAFPAIKASASDSEEAAMPACMAPAPVKAQLSPSETLRCPPTIGLDLLLSTASVLVLAPELDMAHFHRDLLLPSAMLAVSARTLRATQAEAGR